MNFHPLDRNSIDMNNKINHEDDESNLLKSLINEELSDSTLKFLNEFYAERSQLEDEFKNKFKLVEENWVIKSNASNFKFQKKKKIIIFRI